MPDAPEGDVAVLVPAAGSGTRLGGQRKQYRLLGDAPLLVQTLRAFDRHPHIACMIVAVPEIDAASMQRALDEEKWRAPLRVVAGGASRQDSVAAALHAAPESVAMVLVHDAVRPFLSPDSIAEVIHAVRMQGAAALAVPLADTLRAGADGQFAETRPRDGLFRMQTPQGCRRDWFEAAHEKARAESYQATDDVDLVQRSGKEVAIVQGDPLNIKITTPEDWAFAQWLWPQWEARISAQS